MFQPKPFRDTNNLVSFHGQGSWSQWMRAMVPTSSRFTENRGPRQEGYMWSNIRNELNGVAGLCGIYEFQVRGTLPHHLQSAVVYVGSTCQRPADGGQCRRLNSRIINYCRHGNHKADLINDALRRDMSCGSVISRLGVQRRLKPGKMRCSPCMITLGMLEITAT